MTPDTQKNKKIYLASPHMSEQGYEMQYVRQAFAENWIAPLGPNVNAFEREFAQHTHSPSAVALSAGTAAIHMALKAVGVTRGDVVFCSSLTFSASANPILYQNAIPVFIDSEPQSWNMSPTALEEAFSKYMPKAVIVVNLYGQSADMDRIQEICNAHKVAMIEDSAESLGATYKGKMSGTFGKYGVFSFNGNKIITTSGGGMLVSEDEEMIRKVRFWATQSRENERHYEHKELGYNYRMSNVSAGIGRGQLKILNERIAGKKEIYEAYKASFQDIPEIEMMPVCDYGVPNYWLSCMTVHKDSKVKPLDMILALEAQDIESRPIWKPMQMQPFFKECRFFSHNSEKGSISQDIFERGICLPSDTKMDQADMDRIISIIKGLF